MALEFHWLGEESQERVVKVRLRSFGAGSKEKQRFADATRTPIEPMEREFLVASHDGEDVGTTCSIDLNMWIAGAAVPCQGVGYVGTIKTQRRGAGGEKGLASQMMWQTIARARERGRWVTALMPFRASYYEHFGYGVMEHRHEWTVPMGLFPSGPCAGFRFLEESDLPALMGCRNKIARKGQCDIERPENVWQGLLKRWEDGFVFIDRPDAQRPVHSWMALTPEIIEKKPGVRVNQMGFDSMESLRRQLYFLSSLQDQHLTAILSLPSDLPLNLLLKESLVPLMYSSHKVATARRNTRMMMKILDNPKLLSAMRWPADAKGSAVVRVAMADGSSETLKIDVQNGKGSAVATSLSPQFECPERLWTAIIFGDLSAMQAVRFGLVSGEEKAVALLETLSGGPKPYCLEYF
ncbi:MAG TPA: GNAT family N-acetyltransferase [Tepidisphaeraceae bacterium]|jgi:predicted acetyltransferase